MSAPRYWMLPCTECEWQIRVFVDSGTGEQAAEWMRRHVQENHPGVDPHAVLSAGKRGNPPLEESR